MSVFGLVMLVGHFTKFCCNLEQKLAGKADVLPKRFETDSAKQYSCRPLRSFTSYWYLTKAQNIFRLIKL